MNRPSPPLLGFNNNVRHHGRVFHIQTEDSGIKYCRVVTHLFADGGRILRSNRTDYSAQKDAPDLAVQVRRLMKEQHRSMYTSLRSGEYDDIISRTFDNSNQAEADPLEVPASQQYQLRSEELPALSLPAPAEMRAQPESLPQPVILVTRPSNRPKRPSSRAPAKVAACRESKVESARSPAEDYIRTPAAASSSRIQLGRPPLDSAENPRFESSRSLFGESLSSEQSLGDVILSYVEEAVDKRSGRR